MIRLAFVLSASLLIRYRLRGQGTKTRGGMGKFKRLGPKIRGGRGPPGPPCCGPPVLDYLDSRVTFEFTASLKLAIVERVARR